MINNLILYIVCYYKIVKVIIFVGLFVTDRVSVDFGLVVDNQICATSRLLSTSYWLRLSVLILLVIIVVEFRV